VETGGEVVAVKMVIASSAADYRKRTAQAAWKSAYEHRCASYATLL